MAKSSDPIIQGLMDQTEAINPSDPDILTKLNDIAQKVVARQCKLKAVLTGQPIDDSNLVDPSDQFACEGCQ